MIRFPAMTVAAAGFSLPHPGAAPPELTLAIGAGEMSLFLMVLVAVVVPIAAFAFARSGHGLDQLGKGNFAVEFETDSGDSPGDEDREDEVRQLVEARAFRHESRGEGPGELEAEVDRLLALASDAPGGLPAPTSPAPLEPNPISGPPGAQTSRSIDDESGLREEIRQIVIARNERRERRGDPPLEVEPEIERRLRELTSD